MGQPNYDMEDVGGFQHARLIEAHNDLKESNARLLEDFILLQRSKVRAYTSLQVANERIARLREALAEVEWVWTGVANIWRCPLCEALREVGHQPGCKVGSALKEGE